MAVTAVPAVGSAQLWGPLLGLFLIGLGTGTDGTIEKQRQQQQQQQQQQPNQTKIKIKHQRPRGNAKELLSSSLSPPITTTALKTVSDNNKITHILTLLKKKTKKKLTLLTLHLQSVCATCIFDAGGIKPCVAAFGGDQFSESDEGKLGSFFSLFYFSINAGSVLSMLITPYLRGDQEKQ